MRTWLYEFGHRKARWEGRGVRRARQWGRGGSTLQKVTLRWREKRFSSDVAFDRQWRCGRYAARLAPFSLIFILPRRPFLRLQLPLGFPLRFSADFYLFPPINWRGNL